MHFLLVGGVGLLLLHGSLSGLRQIFSRPMQGMLTDAGVCMVKGGQTSLQLVLPYEESSSGGIIMDSKLGLQEKHIIIINCWRLTLRIIQFYHQAVQDP